MSDKEIQLHFDGKSVQQFIDGKVKTKERIAVIASSPTMQKDVLLDSSKGADQVKGILPLIEKFDIADNIFAVNMDSTASNTGKWRGSATILQKEINQAYIYLLCRHHIVETYVSPILKIFELIYCNYLLMSYLFFM